MDFNLSEQAIAIQEAASDFAENEMLPFAREWDEKHIFPIATLKKAATLGFAGMYVKNNILATTLTHFESVLVFEALAMACPSTAAYLSIHNMVASIIDQYASKALQDKWLPELIQMNAFSSYCLTEPNSGSDAASLKTTAVRVGDEYVLNGAKAFISGGGTSDIYVCMVRTGDQSAKGISCKKKKKTRAGIQFGKQEQKLGWHSQPTTMVFFENCRIPVSNLIGAEGQGFNIALSALNSGRINIAACSLGGAKQCLQLTKNYMQERTQFKHKLADFQALQFRYADMLTDFEAAKLMTYRAAHAFDQNDKNMITYSAMAKRFATDVCFNIVNQSLQLHVGYGYLKEYPIERYF